ncbi:DUF1850 domain-containing protein [Xanthobacter autotrophicus]|uniref:DUF1850 domain-containing protein n=1 Tax=Xanthobacter autotrophicus TaxID=280 RepID=UPI00372B3495
MPVACLVAGAYVARLAVMFTLAWTHSVAKSEWQEDWRATPGGLVLDAVRVEGSGAGMEPPDDAVREGRFYVAHPRLPPQREVLLRRSGATADWRVCMDGSCRPMGALLPVDLPPADADPVRLILCE